MTPSKTRIRTQNWLTLLCAVAFMACFVVAAMILVR
jgi:hypothetical protein